MLVIIVDGGGTGDTTGTINHDRETSTADYGTFYTGGPDIEFLKREVEALARIKLTYTRPLPRPTDYSTCMLRKPAIRMQCRQKIYCQITAPGRKDHRKNMRKRYLHRLYS